MIVFKSKALKIKDMPITGSAETPVHTNVESTEMAPGGLTHSTIENTRV
jgi:hypothetical protein